MIPRALDPFLAFPQALRATGFPASPDRTETFLTAVGLLGPRRMADVRRAAHAVYGPGPDRQEMFDTVFDAVFLGRSIAAPAPGDPEDLPPSFDAGAFEDLIAPEDEDPSGGEATTAERLFARELASGDEDTLLRRFSRALPHSLPRRRSRRFASGKGQMADARRAFRDMMRRDGEISRLPTRHRVLRERRVVMLIDVSGSMKQGTEGALRLAHALVQGGQSVECFTLGTRLTRVTRPLRHKNREQALALASGLVADWDGGTRLGEAMAVFLSIPRFAAHTRGALVVVVSDGLERGGPEALIASMQRLRSLAWSVLWLSPLAADPAFRPETSAMQAVLPMLDRLGNGATPPAIAEEILSFAKGVRR
jgi:uncharacterized protein with von Willebrand factor type A (vWA) domain